jgi:hypothetical protein
MRINPGTLVVCGPGARPVHLTVLHDSAADARGLELPDGWQVAMSERTGLTVAVRPLDEAYWKGPAEDSYLCHVVDLRGIVTTTRRQTNEEWRETGHETRIIGVLGDKLPGLYRPHINATNATI